MTLTSAPLVSTQWLGDHLDAPNLRIADASWYLPQTARDAAAEYGTQHLPGARFFDIDALSDPTTKLPHMLPPPHFFARQMEEMGIGDEHFVVLYDGAGMYSAPRAWWMLHAMGHSNCAVLDGGLPKWRREKRAVTTTPPELRPVIFTPNPRPELNRKFQQMRDLVEAGTEQVLDARSPTRFCGDEEELRPGVRPGHIPGSNNLHYAELVTPDGTLLGADALRRLFASRGLDLARPTVTSCGSGITAAILFLALEIAGARDIALYDGSWSEWGARSDAPLETGLVRP